MVTSTPQPPSPKGEGGAKNPSPLGEGSPEGAGVRCG
jgi:hypothetical protein